MTPDATLLRQAQAGDITAFEALVRRHFGLVFTIALARLRDREIAEDLAQEVMLRAFLHLKSLRADSTFAAWVARIARNLAIDWRRRGQRASRLLPQVPLDQAKMESLRVTGKGAREAMATHEESEALRKALFNLPEDQRELVLLHHSEGLSQSELAERLGTTQATISRRLKAAREALRDQLEPLIREFVPALRPSQSAVAKSVAFIAGAAALSSTAKAGLAASAPVGSLAEASVGAVGMAGSLSALIAGGIKAMATGKGVIAAAAAAVAVGGGIYLTVPGEHEAQATTRESNASMLPHPGVFAVGSDGNLIELALVPAEEDRRLEEMANAMETDADATAVMREVDRIAERINAPIVPPDAWLLFYQPKWLAEMQASTLPDVDQVRFDADMASLRAVSSVQQQMHLSDRVPGLMEIQPTEPFSGDIVAVSWNGLDQRTSWLGRVESAIDRHSLDLPGNSDAQPSVPEGPHRASLIQPDGTQISLASMTERQLEPLLEDVPGSIRAGRIPVMQPGATLLFQGENLTEAHFRTGPGGLPDAIRFGAISMTEGREWNLSPRVSRAPASANAWEVRFSGPLGDFIMIARNGSTPDEDIGHIVAIAGSPLVP